MTFGWARSPRAGIWHAFALFEGYRTSASICSSGMALPDTLLPKPITQGDEGICQNCKYGVIGMKKRYRLAGSVLLAPGTDGLHERIKEEISQASGSAIRLEEIAKTLASSNRFMNSSNETLRAENAVLRKMLDTARQEPSDG